MARACLRTGCHGSCVPSISPQALAWPPHAGPWFPPCPHGGSCRCSPVRPVMLRGSGTVATWRLRASPSPCEARAKNASTLRRHSGAIPAGFLPEPTYPSCLLRQRQANSLQCHIFNALALSLLFLGRGGSSAALRRCGTKRFWRLHEWARVPKSQARLLRRLKKLTDFCWPQAGDRHSQHCSLLTLLSDDAGVMHL